MVGKGVARQVWIGCAPGFELQRSAFRNRVRVTGFTLIVLLA